MSSRRVTQADIARLAGVSQTTVSLVLNNRDEGDGGVRLAPETRARVQAAIRETGYVADPLARRLTNQLNGILGVFTYEPAFPIESGDFYRSFLSGIEHQAEQLGCDLLLFTSAPVTDGRREVFHEGSRIRLADGCLLLGRSIPAAELGRLIAEDVPFVSIGRRDDADGAPVPYVGADYAAATRSLVTRARELGHHRLGFVGSAGPAESTLDRQTGFADASAGAFTLVRLLDEAEHTPSGVAALLDGLLAESVTVVFCDDLADAEQLWSAARERGLSLPDELSVVALGSAVRRAATGGIDFASITIPREEMGRRATQLLHDLLVGVAVPATQILLPCGEVAGSTLAAPRSAALRAATPRKAHA